MTAYFNEISIKLQGKIQHTECLWSESKSTAHIQSNNSWATLAKVSSNFSPQQVSGRRYSKILLTAVNCPKVDFRLFLKFL